MRCEGVRCEGVICEGVSCEVCEMRGVVVAEGPTDGGQQSAVGVGCLLCQVDIG